MAVEMWTMLGNWVMRAEWLLAAPHVMEAAAVLGGALLAGMIWPRGCCKQDALFSRKTL